MNNYTHTADGSIIYYRSKSEICFRSDGSTVEDYITDNEVWKNATDRKITDLTTKVDAITADSLGAVKKAGDKMTGQLQKDGVGSSWVKGRENAFIRQTTSAANIYCPVLSVKSETGSWELGTYQADTFHLSHISDANYNANANTQTANFQFTKDGRIIASTFVGALSGKATSAGAADTASALSYFKNTSTSNVGLDTTDANAIGYVSGTSGIYGISDGMLIKQVYSSAWMGEIYLDYRTGQIATRGKNNGTLQAWRKQLDSVNYKTYCTPANIGAAASSHSHSNNLYGKNYNTFHGSYCYMADGNASYFLSISQYRNIFNTGSEAADFTILEIDWIRPRYKMNTPLVSKAKLAIQNTLYLSMKHLGAAYTSPSNYGGMFFLTSSMMVGITYANELAIIINYSSSSNCNSSGLILGKYQNTGEFRPVHDNHLYLGTSEYRWKQIYAATATISTSDRTKKKEIQDFNDDFVIKLIMALKPKTYKFKDNDSNRTHYGFIAQDIEDVFPELGINSKDIAAFIKSPNTRTVSVPSEKEGEPPSSREEVIPEGEEGYGFKYSLRYEEFISPLTRVVQLQQKRLDEFEMQLKEKDDKISNLENTIFSMMARLEALENMQN